MASEKVLDAKKEIVSEIKAKLSDASSVIFFDYHGLSVIETTELRNKLRASNSDMKIYKNTMMRRALDNLGFDMNNILEGPNAISLSNDIIEPIKVLTKYAKEHKALEIKGGIVDGKVSSLEELAKLATIPSREGLLVMLAGGMLATVKNLAISLQLYSEQKSE